MREMSQEAMAGNNYKQQNQVLRGQAAPKSWLFLGGCALIATLNGQGCGWEEEASDSPLPQESVESLLGDVGEYVVIPELNLFLDLAEEVSSDIEVLSGLLNDGSDTTQSLANAKESFVELFLQWQVLEAMAIGPAASSTDSVFGRGLRDEIYSWPTTNECRVDQETVTSDWDDEDFYDVMLVNVYGLDSLEHLLFGPMDSVCPSQTPPVADGSWDALGPEGIELNRIAFATSIVDNIILNGQELVDLWSSGEAIDYSGVATPDETLEGIYHSLYYIETFTKDLKLFHPMGEYECSTEFCLDDIEAQASGLAVESICANITGFMKLYSGGEGQGFDDLLNDMDQGELSQSITAQAEESIQACEALSLPLDEAITTENAQLYTLSEAVGGLGRLVKSDMASVLFFRPPGEAAGDND